MRSCPVSAFPVPALAALGLLSLGLAARPADAATLLVPQQFPTIQAALNAAKPYDTVLVSAKPRGGVYNEAVTISTAHVVLQGRGSPIIDGTGLGTTGLQGPFATVPTTLYPNGIDIRADHVAVRGLTVQNTGSASAGPIIFGFPFFPVSSAVNVGSISQTPTGPVELSYSDIEISGVVARNNVNGINIAGYAGSISIFSASPFATALTGGYRLIGDVVSGSTGVAAQIAGPTGLQVTGCRFTGNAGAGLTVGVTYEGPPAVQNALVAGNVFAGNSGDGLDADGSALTVTGNEVSTNGASGMSVTMALATTALPNPPANTISFNSVHDNQSCGLSVTGQQIFPTGQTLPAVISFNSIHDNHSYGLSATQRQTISGNVLSHNTGYGVYLKAADSSIVTYNYITGTVLSGQDYDDGTGLYADDSAPSYYGYFGTGGTLSISANAVDRNAGDGIYLAVILGSTLSYNDASGNAGIGIHLSDFPYTGLAPNTVTLNHAVSNTLFDARDDSSAPDDLTYNGYTSYGDNLAYGPTINVWTKNRFGTTDPVGLSN